MLEAAVLIVGNQIIDLIREVQYHREDRGTVYFEPVHMQYLPVRSNRMDTIEVQIAETDGTLVQFNTRNNIPCIVTFHFKNIV